MKSNSLLAFLALACLPTTALHATTYTVDNANPGAADFADLAVAVAKASAGDTLLLAGSATSYGSVTLDKQLHLIGPGWSLLENYPDASPSTAARIDELSINSATGSGSSLTSLRIGTIDLDNTSRILVRRIAPPSNTQITYLFANNVSHATIHQNYRISVQGNTLTADCLDLKILNNVIVFALNIALLESQIENNLLLLNTVTLKGATVRYNLLAPKTNPTFKFENCLVEYNVLDRDAHTDPSNTTTWPGDKNFNDADSSTYFVSNGSFDSRYHLALGSDAANVLKTGNDAGPFGGASPYVLSGLPAVPVIYHIDAPATAQAGELVNISFTATAEPDIDEGSSGETD